MDSNGRLQLRATMTGPEDFDEFSLPGSAVDIPSMPSPGLSQRTGSIHRRSILLNGEPLQLTHVALPAPDEPSLDAPNSPVSSVGDGPSISSSPINTLPPGSTFLRYGGDSSRIRRVPAPLPVHLHSRIGGHSQLTPTGNVQMQDFALPHPSPLRAATFPSRTNSSSGIEMTYRAGPIADMPPRSSSTPPDSSHMQSFMRPPVGPSGLNRSSLDPAVAALNFPHGNPDEISRIGNSDIADPNPPPPYTRYPGEVPKDEENVDRRGYWRIGSSAGGDYTRRCLGIRERRLFGIKVIWIIAAAIVLGVTIIILGAVLGTRAGRKDPIASKAFPTITTAPNEKDPPKDSSSDKEMDSHVDPLLPLGHGVSQNLFTDVGSESWGCIASGSPLEEEFAPPPNFRQKKPYSLWSCDLSSSFDPPLIPFNITKNAPSVIMDPQHYSLINYTEYPLSPYQIQFRRRTEYLHTIMESSRLLPLRSLATKDIISSYLSITPDLHEGVQPFPEIPLPLFYRESSPTHRFLSTRIIYRKLTLLSRSSYNKDLQTDRRRNYRAKLKIGDTVYACLWPGTQLEVGIRIRHDKIDNRTEVHPSDMEITIEESLPPLEPLDPFPLDLEESSGSVQFFDYNAEVVKDNEPGVRCRELRMSKNGLSIPENETKEFTLKGGDRECTCSWG